MSTISSLDHRVAVAFYGKFSRLRPPQELAMRPLLEGKNLVLCSGTGSGKTEAVMAPIVSQFWKSALQLGQLAVLYIAPTKALVNDLEKRLFLPLNSLGLRVGVRHGDRDDLKRGERPHVLITTPESLDVMLFRGDEPLRDIRAVVVDEVHLLYNTQRGLHLSVLLRRLCKITSKSPQIAMLSATIGRLSDVTLTTPSPVDWESIPVNPAEYEPVFHLLFEVSGEQSLYQTLLPMEFQRQEFLQQWLKDETIPSVLNRLRNSKPIEAGWFS